MSFMVNKNNILKFFPLIKNIIHGIIIFVIFFASIFSLGKTIDEYNLVEEDASFYLKTGDVKPIWKHTKKKMKGMHGH